MFITYFKKTVANKEETEFLPWSEIRNAFWKKKNPNNIFQVYFPQWDQYKGRGKSNEQYLGRLEKLYDIQQKLAGIFVNSEAINWKGLKKGKAKNC